MTEASSSSSPFDDSAEFDEFAENYDNTLNQALALSGEDKNYFARNRVGWLSRWIIKMGIRPGRVLDYGCGVGGAVPFLFDMLGANWVIGVDVSAASLDIARQMHNSRPTIFMSLADYAPPGDVDVAYCNGVFHHIPISERHEAAARIFLSVRPGGVFAFWENNPWNPGARYSMRINPFDREAIPLTPNESRRLLKSVGFDILMTNYLFIFPRFLAWFRWLEPLACRIPLGAQYLVLCQRPE